MAGKLDFDPGQAAMGHKLTISEVLAEYLRMERGHLAPKTHARYTEVIVLFTQSLNGYAANSLSQFDRARFDKLFNAEGEQHREFCDMFGSEHILENVGEFLNYFMVSKVMAGADTLRASGTVVKKLAKWLAEHDYVGTDDAALTIAQGADAARNLPAAEKLSALLYDLTTGRHVPKDSDIEGRFSITKVERGRIWLQDDDDGEDYGPILLTEQATKLCRVGWTISGAVRKSGNRCVLVEAFQVYPEATFKHVRIHDLLHRSR